MSSTPTPNRIGLTASIAGAALGFAAGGAQAGTYDWSYSGDFVSTGSGSGQLTETSGVISAFSGTWFGSTITGLINVGGFNGNDNALPLTGQGVSFLTGTTQYNLIFDGTFYQWGNSLGNGSCGGTFDTTPVTAAVPEPASAGILGAGVAALLAARRRRRLPAAA